MMHHVTVIDYGIGNVYSVCNALLYAGATPLLTDDPSIIAKSERVILPGVGSFSYAMKNLRDKRLDGAIANFIDTGRPFLGICVGMQVMMDYSTELGEHPGFGYIPGCVEKIISIPTNGPTIKVPHVGWAEVKSCNVRSGNLLDLSAADVRNNFFSCSGISQIKSG
jgi:glutamine amidotransferase